MSDHNEADELRLRLDFVREQLFGKKRFSDLSEPELKQVKFVNGAVGGAKESGKISKALRALVKEVGDDQDSVLGHAVGEIIKGIGHMATLYQAFEALEDFQDNRFVQHLIDRTSEGEFRIVLGGASRGIKEPSDSLQMRQMTSAHYTMEDGVDTIFLATDIPQPSTKDDTQAKLFDGLARELLNLYCINKLDVKAVRPMPLAASPFAGVEVPEI